MRVRRSVVLAVSIASMLSAHLVSTQGLTRVDPITALRAE